MAELDLAGIITRVCEDLKIKFSKVSFTSTRNTPNTVAFITVDGVTHRICAPAASTDTPLMDGTASYGTSNNYYARADHVHPTDTSRQATLVSGTNSKTVNGTSLLGSGNISTSELPTVTTSDNGKVLLVVSGAWAAASLPSANGVSF